MHCDGIFRGNQTTKCWVSLTTHGDASPQGGRPEKGCWLGPAEPAAFSNFSAAQDPPPPIYKCIPLQNKKTVNGQPPSQPIQRFFKQRSSLFIERLCSLGVMRSGFRLGGGAVNGAVARRVQNQKGSTNISLSPFHGATEHRAVSQGNSGHRHDTKRGVSKGHKTAQMHCRLSSSSSLLGKGSSQECKAYT